MVATAKARAILFCTYDLYQNFLTNEILNKKHSFLRIIRRVVMRHTTCEIQQIDAKIKYNSQFDFKIF